MKVSDAMTRDVRVASPHETIYDAARAMEAMDIGALPVGQDDRLVGMVTDRDIVVRALARSKGPNMHVAANMAELRVRRLPVVDRDKRLVGIISLGDIAMAQGRAAAGEAIIGVSRPGGPHSQKTRA